MTEQKMVYISLFIAIGLCGVGLSLETPGINSPVGSGTVPPTAYKSGLTPSANPIDTSGNLVITGNVAGGMYFRGVVPYSSTTNFLSPASSLSHTSGGIDSFLRDSAGSQNFGQRSRGLTPYYSPTQTVTTTIPGTRGMVTTPAAGGTEVTWPSGGGLESGQTGYYQSRYVQQVSNRPLSLSQQEMEKFIEADVTRHPLGGEPVEQEQFWKQLRVPIEPRPEPPQGSQAGTGQPVLATGTEPNVAMLLSSSARQENQPATAGRERLTQQLSRTLEPGQGQDIYEQMKRKTGTPAMDMNLPGKRAGETATGPNEANISTGGMRPAVSTMGAGSVIDTYKSFAAYSDDKFNRHIMAAESYMKQGRFYRAADAYTLATIYKPNDPLGYGGKSISLFATGEYMSSALFLARAIEIFPEYANIKIDLIGMIGDKDTVENRILEAREWLDRSGSGELEFLLSYVYYQMDRLDFAKKAIESASKKMPDSPAVAAMKKAIDERISKL